MIKHTTQQPANAIPDPLPEYIGWHDSSLFIRFNYRPSNLVRDARNEPVPRLLDRLVRHLRARGWRVVQDRSVGKCIRHHYRIATKGDLFIHLEASGRCLQMEAWTEYNRVNPRSGRYDFDKLDKMRYLDRIRWLLERSKIAAMFPASLIGGDSTRRSHGMDWIIWNRSAVSGTQRFSPNPIRLGESPKDTRNATSADGSLLVEGQKVAFLGYDHRLQHGTAFHNINNMWWTLLPCGTIRNLAAFELWPAAALPARAGRHGEQWARKTKRRLEALMAAAAGRRDFERAIVLRNALAQLTASGKLVAA